MIKNIAIQGIEGCFHDAAAQEYFLYHHPEMEVKVQACDTFPLLFSALKADPEMLGIVAIENTIAGPLLQNHELLRQSGLSIAGETKMRISHSLAVKPGMETNDIKSVYSHPMALMQCDRFFEAHPDLHIVEYFDTAGAARDVACGVISGGAVCSAYAADLYGLKVVESEIETDRHNFTRFLILANRDAQPSLFMDPDKCNKATIAFTLPHSQGALSKVLAILSFYDLNLTKIQSTPIVGVEWEYRFYVDFEYTSPLRFAQAIDAVRPLMNDFSLLGEYVAAPNPPIAGITSQPIKSSHP